MPEVVRLYSDFICPYCFIAERSVVRELEREYDLDIDWRGFQLHPQIPPGGVDPVALFGEHRFRRMRQAIRDFAGEMGVEIGEPEHLPNTLRALALCEYARDGGRLVPVREALMNAYWRDNKDIESDAVLGDIADMAGLDVTAAIAASDDPAYFDRVLDGRSEAHDHMVSGIPTFFFGEYMVVGCQSYETMAKVADKVGLPRRSP